MPIVFRHRVILSAGGLGLRLGSPWVGSTGGLWRVVIAWAALAATCLVGLLLVARSAHALEVPPLEGPINDRAGVLPADLRRNLTARLDAYQKNTGHQLAVLLLPSLESEPIEDFTLRVAEAWKLGDKDRDDGIVMLVAVNDRKVRIEVGYGLEGDVPDALVGRIIREVMAPAFRENDFAGGITRSVEVIMAATGGGGEPLPPERVQARRSREGLPPYVLLLLVLLLFVGGGRRGGGALVAGALMGMGGGGGRSGGGGGGFRGGGGGFGGGGASGSW